MTYLIRHLYYSQLRLNPRRLKLVGRAVFELSSGTAYGTIWTELGYLSRPITP